jgi:hypothetical protein
MKFAPFELGPVLILAPKARDCALEDFGGELLSAGGAMDISRR